MKVAFLAAHLADGGAERVLSDLTMAMPETIEPLVILFEERITYPFRGKLVTLASPTRSMSLPIRAYRFAQRIHRLRAVLREEKPSCVVSFLGEPNIVNALVSDRPIMTIHGNPTLGHQRFLSGKVLRCLMPLLHRRGMTVAVCEGIRDELVTRYRLPADRVKTIYNPVDTANIRARAGESDPSVAGLPPGPRLVAVGRLVPEKRLDILLRAFAAARKRRSCSLVILGDGPERNRLELQAEELGISDAVWWGGWRRNPFPIMAACHAMVSTSAWEGFGLVLVEAMACSLPIVATDCQFGPREILAPGTDLRLAQGVEKGAFGLLAPAPPAVGDGHRTEEALAEALISVLSDNGLARELILAGQKRLKDFGTERSVGSYVRIIEGAS